MKQAEPSPEVQTTAGAPAVKVRDRSVLRRALPRLGSKVAPSAAAGVRRRVRRAESGERRAESGRRMADMWKWNVARHGCPLSVAPSETWERLPRDPIQPKSKSVEYTAAGISILEGFLRLPTAEQEAMGWLCQDLQQAPAAFGTVHSYFYRLHRSSSWVVKQPDEPGIVSTAKPKMARTIAPDGAPVVVEATGGAMLKLTQQGGGSVHHYTFDGSTMVKGPDFVKVHARTVHADIACSPPSRAHTPRAPRAPAHAHDRLQAPPTRS